MKKLRSAMMMRKSIFAAAAVLLLGGCGSAGSSQPAASEDSTAAAATSSPAVQEESSPQPSATPEPRITASEEIEYTFPADREDWRLELYSEETAGEKTYRIRVYDGQGELQQDIPCNIKAPGLRLRWGELYTYADLAVFPEDAQTAGTAGLLFLWDSEAGGFQERAVRIPWYDEAYGDGTFLVTDIQEDVEERTLCCVVPGSFRTAELRKWTLKKDGGPTAKGELLIWDCLEKMSLYNGKVEWDDSGELVNNTYYEELFRERLKYPWDTAAPDEIPVIIAVRDEEDNWDWSKGTYESREAFLADCGFGDAEPFYQYCDRLQNLELELYLDEGADKCCGFCYSYDYDLELKKVVRCSGFLLDGFTAAAWEEEALSFYGEKETEVPEDSEVPEGSETPEDSPMSVTCVYRDDGTLYCKHYRHDPMIFGTAGQTGDIYYDEMGRPVYRYEYITHGSLQSYYIYSGKSKRPRYGLCLDWNGEDPIPEMNVYR